MSIEDLKKRVDRLKSASSSEIISTWTDYVRWCYFGRDPNAVWDPQFRQEMEELAEEWGLRV
jgi:hypothetical protein